MTHAPLKIKIDDGINFTVVKDDRFKTGKISVSILLPLNEKTASENAIIPFLLVRSCKKYPDFTRLNERLADLYGATVSADVDKLGEAQVLTLSATFLDDRYTLNSECISEEIAKLLCDMIFNPNIQNNSFLSSNVEQEKRQLIEMIDAEYNDKRLFAKQRCMSIMCKDEKFSVNPLGTKENVKDLNGPQIYDAFTEMLRHARFEIMMLGSSDHVNVLEKFKNAFLLIKDRKPLDCSAKFIKTVSEVKNTTEHDNISQCKMVIGFRTSAKNVDDNVEALRIMNALFGATPHSKLFLNVREKLSLCYYCASRFDKNKGILTVESGVEKQNIESAKNEVLKQLDEIKNGNFSDQDIDVTKLSVCNSFKTIADHLGGLEGFYLAQTFSKYVKTPEDIVESIKNVSRQDIINAAKGLSLDTVYALTNQD